MAHKILASVVLGLALGVAVSGQPQPRAFFKDYARLSDGEIQKIEQGQVVTKVLGSPVLQQAQRQVTGESQ